ncbi:MULTISPECIES: DUF2057 family protein [Vibrio]|uniref:UPF0319 protein GFB47_12490 n=1 Tax=Vibrio algicola TaxID=2662262 RepID=A0A5Q0TJ32_9VIBR|nr:MULTISPECIES: DUF2057 family protein [Vibrio]MBD1577336.1 DUF2057 family protein [Vibrio sp. S11_S32]
MSITRSVLTPAALAALLCFSATAAADVTIKFPSNVDMLATNSADPDINGGLFASEKSVTLPDGVNQIVFRYQPVFQEGNDQVNVTTDAIITKFDATDSQLELVMPKYRSADQARDFDKNPTWKLVDQNGNEVKVAQDKLLKNGVQLGRKYEVESVAYNKKGGVAAITAVAATAPVAASAPVAATTTTAVQYQNTEEEMLHQWFDKADTATQQRFTSSVMSQAFAKTKPATKAAYQNTEEEMLHFWFNKSDSATQQRFMSSIVNSALSTK